MMKELNTLVLLSKLNERFPNLDWKVLGLVNIKGYLKITVDGMIDQEISYLEDAKLMREKSNVIAKIKKSKGYWIWVHLSDKCLVRVKIKIPYESQVFFNLKPIIEIKRWEGELDYCLDELERFFTMK